MQEKIIKQLEKIRPHLQMDGGDVEFISYDEVSGTLNVKLQGACSGCPMSQITLQQGIAKTIQEEIPEVKIVVAV